MKRAITVFILAAALLSGCAGSREAREFAAFQRALADAERIEFTAQITGVAAGAEYAVRVTRAGEELRAELTAPETVAGVTFHSDETGRTLEFDGLILELTPGLPGALSPCEAAGILLGALTQGSLDSAGRAGEYTALTLTAPGEETVMLWRARSGEPVYAEIGRGGTAELIMHIDNWHIEE